MAQTRDKKPSALDRLRSFLKGSAKDSMTKDEIANLIADAEKADKEDEADKSTKDAIAGFQRTIDNLPKMIGDAIAAALSTRDGDDDDEEEDMTEDADEEEGDDKKDKKDKTDDAAAGTAKTVDAATMRTVMQTVRAHAEILAPGTSLNMPTNDAKLTRSKFSDSMCNCKRKALDVAYRTEEGRAAIEPFLQGRTADFAHMNAKTIDVIFTGAAITRGARNNDHAARGLRASVARDDFGRMPITNDSLNKAHGDFWKQNGGTAAGTK